MANYPKYTVRVNTNNVINNGMGTRITVSRGQIGTFQLVEYSGKLWIQAIFPNGKVMVQPKGAIPNNDIRPIITKDYVYSIIKNISSNNNYAVGGSYNSIN